MLIYPGRHRSVSCPQISLSTSVTSVYVPTTQPNPTLYLCLILTAHFMYQVIALAVLSSILSLFSFYRQQHPPVCSTLTVLCFLLKYPHSELTVLSHSFLEHWEFLLACILLQLTQITLSIYSIQSCIYCLILIWFQSKYVPCGKRKVLEFGLQSYFRDYVVSSFSTTYRLNNSIVSKLSLLVCKICEIQSQHIHFCRTSKKID